MLMKEAAKEENERARKMWGYRGWDAKAAARENGKLGGRPKSKPTASKPKKEPRPFNASMLKPKPVPKPKPKAVPEAQVVAQDTAPVVLPMITDRVKVIDRMLGKDWSAEDIADVLGVSVDVVDFLRLEFGLPTKKD
jgi:hypothetical protein